jgi:hypothetical protein
VAATATVYTLFCGGGGRGGTPLPCQTPLLLQGNLCWIVAFGGDIRCIWCIHPVCASRVSDSTHPPNLPAKTQPCMCTLGPRWLHTIKDVENNKHYKQTVKQIYPTIKNRTSKSSGSPCQADVSALKHSVMPPKCEPLWCICQSWLLSFLVAFNKTGRGPTPPTQRRAHCAVNNRSLSPGPLQQWWCVAIWGRSIPHQLGRHVSSTSSIR